MLVWGATGVVAEARATPEVPALEEILPPEIPWDGASRALVVTPDDVWITPCEGARRT